MIAGQTSLDADRVGSALGRIVGGMSFAPLTPTPFSAECEARGVVSEALCPRSKLRMSVKKPGWH